MAFASHTNLYLFIKDIMSTNWFHALKCSQCYLIIVKCIPFSLQIVVTHVLSKLALTGWMVTY